MYTISIAGAVLESTDVYIVFIFVADSWCRDHHGSQEGCEEDPQPALAQRPSRVHPHEEVLGEGPLPEEEDSPKGAHRPPLCAPGPAPSSRLSERRCLGRREAPPGVRDSQPATDPGPSQDVVSVHQYNFLLFCTSI